MTSVTERTKLLSGERQPRYAFDSSIFRVRERRLRKFQLCFCSILAIAFVLTIVAMVAYSIHYSYVNNDNATDLTLNDTFVAENSLLTLLASEWPLADIQFQNATLDDSIEWGDAIISAQQNMKAKDNLEKHTPTLDQDTPSYRHQKVTATSKKGRELSRFGYLQEYTTKYIMLSTALNECETWTVEESDDEKPKHPRCRATEPWNSSRFNSTNTTCLYTTSAYCDTEKIKCNKYQMFRMYDGLCNSLKHPEMFGVAYRPFRRMLPPDYADGIASPRRSRSGALLPSARMVSMVVHRPYYKDDPKFSVMLAVWGQFLDHDITATALSLGANGTSISCCTGFKPTHPECFPVILDPQDPYLKDNITCMEFVRSAPAPQCCLGPREQMNQMTAFIDGSVIYGPDSETATKLRTLKNGLLKMYMTEDNRTLLPLSEDESDGCNREDEKRKGRYCFMSGDSRSNENLHLTTMHLLWARQHNRLAKKLAEINPHWDDERIFQEARKILGAQMQHITYQEFLPILFGPEIMKKFKLRPLKNGYYNGYDENIDPTVANSFAAAAFRFAHTIIPGLMKKLANDTSSVEFVQLHKMLFDPFALYEPGELDRALRGAINTNIEASDTYFTNELKEHLFERNDSYNTDNRKACGLDLVSLNIQRGRDHGLPGYIKWREHCKLGRPKRFNDLRGHIGDDSLINIRAIYASIDDIDLYTGGVSEKPIEGSIIGPTVTCLLLDQFIRLKNGDRFWYENDHLQGFTEEQLIEIRKTSLARVICDNADDIQYVQLRVMEGISDENENTHCADIPQLNLEFWRELRLGRVQVPKDEMIVKTLPQ